VVSEEQDEDERVGRLRELTAQQAAARLGVKVETIYAYVSRGVLERTTGPDGRGSRFDARTVERLAGRRRGATKHGGLSVVLGTGLTLIEQDRLFYRGLDVARLAGAAPFERVAEWLWLGEQPPDAPPASDPARAWRASPDALAAARHAQGKVPEGTPTADRLRVIAAAVSPTDPLRFDLAPDAVVACGRQLIAALTDALPCRGEEPGSGSAPGDDGTHERSIAGRLWSRLTAVPPGPGGIEALDAALVLVADHGLAASTLAARVAASVRADPYSVAMTGLATLAGPLHGGASALVHRMFAEVDRPSRAVGVLGDFLRREKRIPGYGHLIYRGWDPRAKALLEILRGAGMPAERMDAVERVLELLEERVEVSPNIDFVLGALTWTSGMPDGGGEAIFGVARTAGWLAHAIEEYDEPDLRFRPRAHYVGAPPE
jgi:citrate synthase